MSVNTVIPGRGMPSFPVMHVNANAANRTELLAPTGSHRSSYNVTGVTVAKAGSSGDGFRLLRATTPAFNSATDVLTVSDDASLQMGTGDLSISLWFKWKTGTVAAVAGLLSKLDGTDGYKIELTATGHVKVTIGDSDEVVALTGNIVTNGQWHHIAVSVDRSEATGFVLYIDGIVSASGNPVPIESTISGGTTDLTMTGIASVTFYVAAIEIYKAKALTAAEVMALYNDGKGSSPQAVTSLSLGLPLDEGSGTTCYDVSAIGNTVTLTNVTWVADGIPFDEDTLSGSAFIDCSALRTMEFNPAIKIGSQRPLAVLETDGSFELIITGYEG